MTGEFGVVGDDAKTLARNIVSAKTLKRDSKVNLENSSKAAA